MSHIAAATVINPSPTPAGTPQSTAAACQLVPRPEMPSTIAKKAAGTRATNAGCAPITASVRTWTVGTAGRLLALIPAPRRAGDRWASRAGPVRGVVPRQWVLGPDFRVRVDDVPPQRRRPDDVAGDHVEPHTPPEVLCGEDGRDHDDGELR
jgi:hypothetical protein